ncbi:hypothetical protein GIB67_040181 [Kingdonia uniflora]|uniref:Uncharacterized protein n=1 Tax=Kingdonia uniflora TaxID=39325 RepID=A0A7J7MV31_9MAGN|nr:hypothetical protein GIB67_040181 [Kingdonia uniflora]
MAPINDCLMLIFMSLIATLVIRTIFSITRKTKGCLPPSPMSLPIIGHLHHLGPIPHQALHKISTKYGPLIHLYFGSVSCVVASTAEIAKEFLKTHEISFSNRPNSSVAIRYLQYGGAGFAFAPHGPYWKFVKKLCMSELLGGRTLEQQFAVRSEEIQLFLQSMLLKAKMGESANLNVELIKLTNNVITRMCMSKRCSDTDNEADEVRELIQETTELAGKFNLSDFISFCKNLDIQGFKKRLSKLHKKLDVLIEKIIREHEDLRRRTKTGTEGDGFRDLLHILLDVSEDKTAEIKLTRENIKAFILDVFAAGTDTSAITVEWAMAELINHPDVFKKAREEMESVVGNARLVAESDLPSLPYLQAIIKETLRLHSTSPLILRESSEPCKIAGYDIPANTRLFVNAWAIGRDPNHWENPLEFRPERFIINDEEKSGKKVDVRGQHYHLLPFGSGRRGCPGISLALQVVQTTLASMIQCFDWKVGGDGTVDMLEGEGFTLKRAHPLVCVPVVHLNPFVLS